MLNRQLPMRCEVTRSKWSSFYRWKRAYEQRGEAGLINENPIPKNLANRTPPEIVEKVLHLRSNDHLGSIRIVWYDRRWTSARDSHSPMS